MEKESLISLIQKLLALSKSPNENEAALAMAKAQELLLKYNLDMAEIKTSTPDDAGNNDDAGLTNEPIDFDGDDKYSPWERRLISVISSANLCKIVLCGNGVHVLGRKVNVYSVVTMYNWIEPQVIRLAKESGFIRGDKTSYILGICETIDKRLQDNMISYQVNHNCTALVVNIKDELSKYIRSEYPHTGTARPVSIKSYGAYSSGKADGNKVSIHNAGSQIRSGRLALGAGR